MKRDSTAYGAVRPIWDKGDCSVRALAAATGGSYEQCWRIFSAAGRMVKKGTDQSTSTKVHEELLGMRKIVSVEGWTIADFCATFPVGRFVLHRRKHAFAVVDGVLHDWEQGTAARSLIINCWKITEETLRKIEKTKNLGI